MRQDQTGNPATDADLGAGARELLVALDRAQPEPLRRQLESALRGAIRTGRLAAGGRLPSSRDLARQLGVSRGVVVDAYESLAAQGFLTVQPRQAPLVAPAADPHPELPGLEPDLAPRAYRIDFTATAPDASLFPRQEMLRALRQVLAQAPDTALGYGDPRGSVELRGALVDYLGRVRGVVAAPGRVVIVQGFTQAVDITFRALAAGGARRIALEDPSHDEQWTSAHRAGLQTAPVPVDGDGIVVSELARLEVDAVVLTPAHQFPTGVVLAPARRRALLAWAAARSALIVEDDYDSEFRYDRAPVGTLQGLEPSRVVYLGTASKTLAPALRLGWAVVPPVLIDGFLQGKTHADSGSPALEQLAVAQLMARGNYERAVQRARLIYRRRRDALLGAVAEFLPACSVQGIAAGLHVVLRLPDGVAEEAVCAAALRRGVYVRPLGDFRQERRADDEQALVLGYARLHESAVPAAIRELAAVLA